MHKLYQDSETKEFFDSKEEALASMEEQYGEPVEDSCGDLLDVNVERNGKTYDVWMFRTYRWNGGVLEGEQRKYALENCPEDNPAETDLYDFYYESSNDVPMLLLWKEQE